MRPRGQIPGPRPSLCLHAPVDAAAQRKVERSHSIDDEEFYRLLAGEVIDEAELFDTRLHEWERFYNFARPHGALGGQTPLSVYDS
jgi:transposase InsO family protein